VAVKIRVKGYPRLLAVIQVLLEISQANTWYQTSGAGGKDFKDFVHLPEGKYISKQNKISQYTNVANGIFFRQNA
jgi:hypothetical protein